MAIEVDDPNIRKLARRGNITSDNHRNAVTCQDCRTTWYGHTNPFNEAGATVATEYCPYCGGKQVSINEELPGALVLNPGVDWPNDDPFVTTQDNE